MLRPCECFKEYEERLTFRRVEALRLREEIATLNLRIAELRKDRDDILGQSAARIAELEGKAS